MDEDIIPNTPSHSRWEASGKHAETPEVDADSVSNEDGKESEGIESRRPETITNNLREFRAQPQSDSEAGVLYSTSPPMSSSHDLPGWLAWESLELQIRRGRSLSQEETEYSGLKQSVEHKLYSSKDTTARFPAPESNSELTSSSGHLFSFSANSRWSDAERAERVMVEMKEGKEDKVIDNISEGKTENDPMVWPTQRTNHEDDLYHGNEIINGSGSWYFQTNALLGIGDGFCLTESLEQLKSVPTTALRLLSDLPDIEALLDPHFGYSDLDDIERNFVEQSYIRSRFRDLDENGTTALSRDFNITEGLVNRETNFTISAASKNILHAVKTTLKHLQSAHFCHDNISVLVANSDRNGVVHVVDIPISDIEELEHIVGLENGLIQSGMVLNRIETLLKRFGVAIDVTLWKTIEDSFNPGQNRHKLEETLDLICECLSLAVLSYMRSHCSDFGKNIWNTTNLEELMLCQLDIDDPWKFAFKRRRLGCLDGFIGNPVWVFGWFSTADADLPAFLSTTIKQFADLWGPLYAVPAPAGFEKLLAIHTEGGVLFQVSNYDSKIQLEGDEVLVHWISASSPWRRRIEPGRLSNRPMMASTGEEKLPEILTPFSATARLLIGSPTPLNSSVFTATRDTLAANAFPGNLNLTLNGSQGLELNEHCRLDLRSFGLANDSHIQAIGTQEAYYTADSYEVSFSSRNYNDVGISKSWKRMENISRKMR